MGKSELGRSELWVGQDQSGIEYGASDKTASSFRRAILDKVLLHLVVLQVAGDHFKPSFEANVSHGLRESSEPHAIHFRKTHQDMQVAYPP